VSDKVISLVDADPELGELLDPGDYERARRDGLARVSRLSPGVWDAAAALDRDAHHRGFLIADGLMAREVDVVPLPLGHQRLADLVGAHRPSVTTALGELTRAGSISRREDGHWLPARRAAGRAAPPQARLRDQLDHPARHTCAARRSRASRRRRPSGATDRGG
jgi:hypothetical protein